MSEANEFDGRCITCANASVLKAKGRMTCTSWKACTKGIPCAGAGGGTMEMQVHKLFGCVYWCPIDKEQS
jgi:hypothetical protein